MKNSRRNFLKATAAAGLAHATLPSAGHLSASEQPTDEKWPPSPFLKGNFAPVHDEITAESLTVIGHLPDGLAGMYVRNGPNPQFAPRGRYHWFDGDGMLHGVHLRDGKASYRNRYIRTRGFETERKAGRALYTGLAEPPNFKEMLSGGELYKNAANTALVWHNDRLLALWEAGPPHEIELPDLSTLGPYTFEKKLRHPFTAHPKIDPETGEMLFFGYSPIPPYLMYSVADAEGRIKSTTPVKLPRPVMMHDFAITKNYSIFMDLPETFTLGKGGAPMFQFQPELGARFGILPRYAAGAEIRWFEALPCFIFHTLNAFEDEKQVTLIACRMETFPDILSRHDDEAVWNDSLAGAPQLYRWRFDLDSGQTHEEALDDFHVDFPRINDSGLGRPTRFGYTMAADMQRLAKYDLTTGTRIDHTFAPRRFAGEGVFVPRPDSTAEDDGWILTYVFDSDAGTSELVVLDAHQFDAPPIARVLIPVRIPFGFHGTFVAEEEFAV